MADSPVRRPRSPKPAHVDADGVALAERKMQRVEPPRPYQVVMLNDDFTPMEFVVQVLQTLFGKDLETAMRIMLQIHNEGRGVCGVYAQDIAHTKAAQVLQLAQLAGHPLQCVAEPAP